MATVLSDKNRYIDNEFISFSLGYTSIDTLDPQHLGSKTEAVIYLYNSEGATVGIIKFQERQPPLPNTIRPNTDTASHIPYIPEISFHISRFNDIMNILRYQKPLRFRYDLITVTGQINSGTEAIGQQEGITSQ